MKQNVAYYVSAHGYGRLIDSLHAEYYARSVSCMVLCKKAM